MKYTLINLASKKIIGIGDCPQDCISSQADNDHIAIVGHFPSDLYFIDENNNPILKDQKPDDDSEWDEEIKKWKFNKTEARKKLKNKVERERLRRDALDINYDGKNIQADAEARSNIHGKLAEIVAAQALGQTLSPLIWRDSDNIVHIWSDMLIYKAWLQGLVMAIAARSTALYQSLWAHKAAIAELEAETEIKNYDKTIGW